jgi:uncharacterized RDD family membrane protein YckC
VATTEAQASPSLATARTSELNSRRVVARLLDGLVLTALTVVLGWVLGGLSWLAAVLWITVVYFFLCESFVGQTLGKRALGLRVVRRDGGPPSANAIATRNVIRIFEEPLLALLALLGSRKRRQRLGDMAAGTTVGIENASVAPYPSGLTVLYPAIWAALGALLVMTAPPQQPEPPPTLGDPVRNAALATPGAMEKASYLAQLQAMCEARDRYIHAHVKDSVDRVVKYELAYSRRLAGVPAPASMAGARRAILIGRRRVDRVAWELYRGITRSEHPQAYLASLQPRIDSAVAASAVAFHRAGIACGPR